MAEPVTRPTGASVAAFIDAIEDGEKRKDCKALAALFRKVTGEKPEMWGPSIVGFGRYDMVYANGKTQQWLRIGFSPRKNELSIYIWADRSDGPAVLKKLGKAKAARACLYVKRLADIDTGVLKDLIADRWAELAKRYPS